MEALEIPKMNIKKLLILTSRFIILVETAVRKKFAHCCSQITSFIIPDKT